MAASITITGICSICSAQQINGAIVVPPKSGGCEADHTWVDPPSPDVPTPVRSPRSDDYPPMPYQKEAEIFDNVEAHKKVVERNIDRTNNTIRRLEERHDRWKKTIDDDCNAVIEAVKDTRARLLGGLDDLCNLKHSELQRQLDEYTQHLNETEDMLADIRYRVNNDERTEERKQGVIGDGNATIAKFPRLDKVKIAVAVECQMNQFVEALSNFGAVLESNVGRLPLVEITSTRGATVNFTVSPLEDNGSDDDSDVKVSIGDLDLEVEVQASALAEQSMGWDVMSQSRVKLLGQRGTHSTTLSDLQQIGSGNVFVRARSVLLPKNNEEPLRISAWSVPVEMEARPANLPVMMAKLLSDVNGKPSAVRLQGDYEEGLRAACVSKFQWTNPEQVGFQILHRTSKEVVEDLTHGGDINTALTTVFERKDHVILAIRMREPGARIDVPPPKQATILEEKNQDPPHRVWEEKKPPVNERSASPRSRPPVMDLPPRLAVKCRASEVQGAATASVMLRNRENEGDWMDQVRQKCGERFNLDVSGDVDMYFVADDGSRLKEVLCDADLLFSKENKAARVVCAPK